MFRVVFDDLDIAAAVETVVDNPGAHVFEARLVTPAGRSAHPARAPPIPAPRPARCRLLRSTVTREASDGGVKVTITGELADGTPINASYTAKYDGKDVQVTGNAPYDTIWIKQKNANRLTDERKKTGGSYHGTGRTVIWNGGKTMTTTTKGINADGKEMISTFVFDKQ
jgi:hypothetical protein